MFGDIKMKIEKKTEIIEMMTLEIVVIIITSHMRIKNVQMKKQKKTAKNSKKSEK